MLNIWSGRSETCPDLSIINVVACSDQLEIKDISLLVQHDLESNEEILVAVVANHKNLEFQLIFAHMDVASKRRLEFGSVLTWVG